MLIVYRTTSSGCLVVLTWSQACSFRLTRSRNSRLEICNGLKHNQCSWVVSPYTLVINVFFLRYCLWKQREYIGISITIDAGRLSIELTLTVRLQRSSSK